MLLGGRAVSHTPTLGSGCRYSNGDAVELLLNNKSLGVRKVPMGSHAAWTGIKWAAGRLEARAYHDTSSQNVIAVDVLDTSSAPVRYRLNLPAAGAVARTLCTLQWQCPRCFHPPTQLAYYLVVRGGILSALI